MRRFFGSTRIVKRIPPGAPAFVFEVPVPRTTKTTKDVKNAVNKFPFSVEDSPSSSSIASSEYLAKMLPSEVSSEQLVNPKGVWYNVTRSRSGNLPVYLDYNNAGGVWTEIRRITGNSGALKNDLKIKLDLPKSSIWVKNAANSIVIKGNWKKEVREILSESF